MSVSSSIWLEWKQARSRIAAAMVGLGRPSLTSFIESAPQADLVELAAELAIAGLHSGHLLRRLWEEATDAGELARCARDLLVRALCANLQDFNGDPDRLALRLENAFFQWRNHLPLNYHGVADRVRAALLEVPPPLDWRPRNANDSIVVGLFQQHWPVEPPGGRYRMLYDPARGLIIERDRGLRRGDTLVSWPPKS